MSRYRFIEAEKAGHAVTTVCRVLEVSRSAYYDWAAGPSPRAVEDAHLVNLIRDVHAGSRNTYGAPRVHAELADDHGIACGRKRVARLMRDEGLEGVHRRRKHRTTKRRAGVAPAPDLVERDFTASAPDRLWVADITYVPTWAGFLYVAVVLDVFSRRIVGWSMAAHLRTELVLDALEMALWHRRPAPGLVHHSDQGCQGGLNRSSQRLDRGGACRWRRCGSGSERSSCIEGRSRHRGGRRWLGVRTASGSGRRSLGE